MPTLYLFQIILGATFARIRTNAGDPAGTILPAGSLILDTSTPALWMSTDGAGAWLDISAGGGLTVYTDVATAEAASGSDNDLCYVVTTETLYRYEATSGAARDGTYILDTADGGATRWLGVAGRYHSTDVDILTNLTLGGQSSSPIHTLVDGAIISPDMDNGSIQEITLGGNRTMAAPTNMKSGATYIFIINQDATPPRTLIWDPVYLWPAGIPPVLTNAVNAVDIVTFVCDGANMHGVFQGDFR